LCIVIVFLRPLGLRLGEADETHKKVFEEEAKKIINDPDTFIAARDGNVTDEILEAALEIITEQLKEGRKPKK
nr:hypothetical protein [Bacillus pacificus]